MNFCYELQILFARSFIQFCYIVTFQESSSVVKVWQFWKKNSPMLKLVSFTRWCYEDKLFSGYSWSSLSIFSVLIYFSWIIWISSRSTKKIREQNFTTKAIHPRQLLVTSVFWWLTTKNLFRCYPFSIENLFVALSYTPA